MNPHLKAALYIGLVVGSILFYEWYSWYRPGWETISQFIDWLQTLHWWIKPLMFVLFTVGFAGLMYHWFYGNSYNPPPSPFVTRSVVWRWFHNEKPPTDINRDLD